MLMDLLMGVLGCTETKKVCTDYSPKEKRRRSIIVVWKIKCVRFYLFPVACILDLIGLHMQKNLAKESFHPQTQELLSFLLAFG